jgi:hypothetical protein
MPSRGPWRVLILDRSDRDDPRWLLATVCPEGVRPADPGQDVPDQVTAAWAAPAAELVPMPGARAWRIDEGGRLR